MYLLNSFLEGKIKYIINTIKNVNQLDFSKPDNINDLLYNLAGYSFIYTDEYCGGYCSNVNKEIAISKCCDFSYFEYPLIIFHELGHAYQSEYKLIYKETLQDFLNHEWQAEQFNLKILASLEKKI